MVQSIPHESHRPASASWSKTVSRGNGEPGPFAPGAFRAVSLLLRGLFAAMAGVLLAIMHLLIGITVFAVGVLAIPLLIFGMLTCLVLLANAAAWVFEGIGLL